MSNKADLISIVESKIDITGQRLTTGVRTRDAFESVIDALFDQFGQVYSETLNVVANKSSVITIPSDDYQGDIRMYTFFDSSGNDITSTFDLIKKGVSGDDKTLTFSGFKTRTFVEVNILMK